MKSYFENVFDFRKIPSKDMAQVVVIFRILEHIAWLGGDFYAIVMVCYINCFTSVLPDTGSSLNWRSSKRKGTASIRKPSTPLRAIIIVAMLMIRKRRTVAMLMVRKSRTLAMMIMACLSKTGGCLSSLGQSEGSNSSGQAAPWVRIMSRTVMMPRIVCKRKQGGRRIENTSWKHGSRIVLWYHSIPMLILGTLRACNILVRYLNFLFWDGFLSSPYFSPVVRKAPRIWAVGLPPNVIVGVWVLSCFWSKKVVLNRCVIILEHFWTVSLSRTQKQHQ